MSHQKPPAMNPEELPQQRLYEVKRLLRNKMMCQPELELAGSGDNPKKKPSSATFLCQAEWSWSPAHHRLENYHISMNARRNKFVLWVSYFNDWERPWKWETYEEIWTLSSECSSKFRSAQYLILKHWEYGRDAEYLDKFHWIGAEGLLDVADANAIAREVWEPEGG